MDARWIFLPLVSIAYTGCGYINFLSNPEAHRIPPEVTYYDRNKDGRADRERHHYLSGADRDWELRDNDFDGIYELRINEGYSITRHKVAVPVPKAVELAK